MPIQKQEFYEGAALHILARMGGIQGLSYEPPFFRINGKYSVLVKYSTKGRSPWGFTFTPDEQQVLKEEGDAYQVIISMVCGSDGVASITIEQYLEVASFNAASVHLACYRSHGAHYEVRGPVSALSQKIPPSTWKRLLGSNGKELV